MFPSWNIKFHGYNLTQKTRQSQFNFGTNMYVLSQKIKLIPFSPSHISFYDFCKNNIVVNM